MRQVKFRAWDKSLNRWNDYAAQHIYEAKKVGFIELNQFTGLFDKNGNEIYEGDKVRSPYHKNDFEIIFEDGSFWIVTETEHLGVGYLNKVQILKYQLVVIGNIYENPELFYGEKRGLNEP